MEWTELSRNFIGFDLSAKGDQVSYGFNPATGEQLPGNFNGATAGEVEKAVSLATTAFSIYGKFSGVRKAEFLETISDEIMALGDNLVDRCCAETGLPEARIIGERGRTIGQLRMFAELVREGSWVEASIDTAQLDREPVPKPDIRRMSVPMGPVVVFAASNFPLAFSTAGGDTASALAGGNPVIVKAHSGHPGTSALIASAILTAARKTGMPEGVFSLLHGDGATVGQALIKHPGIKAAGFTGSKTAGRILYNLACQRDEPMPFFAEMGSVNPVLLLPQALQNRADQIAELYAGSITLGVGQFCTNPGLILALDGPELDRYVLSLGEAIHKSDLGVMLNENIHGGYEEGLEKVLSQKGIVVEARSEMDQKGPNRGRPTITSVSAKIFLKSPVLSEEIFGPYSLIVKCMNKAELKMVIEKLEGQLTATIMGDRDELDQYSRIISLLKERVGRVIFNGVPTGVEVCPSMHHGGPYPASSDVRFTSVGTAAIKRFVRPLAFQNWPEKLLPDELKSTNPLNIWRLINKEWTKDSIQ